MRNSFNKFELTVLENGVRVFTETVPHASSVYQAIFVGAGSYHEPSHWNGISHNLEHLAFVGTKGKTEEQIAEVFDALGAKNNASTGYEKTTYHTKSLPEDMETVFRLQAEMLLDPSLPVDKIERERGVILEEIKRQHDNLNASLWYLLCKQAHGTHAYGQTVLGSPEIIARLSRQDFLDYMAGTYVSRNIVVGASGQVDHDQFVNLAQQTFGQLPDKAPLWAPLPASYAGGEIREHRADTKQMQTMISWPFLGRADPDRYAVEALARILGGGMSSRLFKEIRQKRSMVYSVYATTHEANDYGAFIVGAGLDSKRSLEFFDALKVELTRVSQDLTEAELMRVKKQTATTFAFFGEVVDGRANFQGDSLIVEGKVQDLEEMLKQREAVTLEQVKRVAADLLKHSPTIASIGNLSELEPREQLLARWPQAPSQKLIV